MKRSLPISNISLWLIILLILLIIFLGIATYLGLFGLLHFKLGPFYFHHWMTLIGSAYIAILVPILHNLRSHNPRRYGTLIKFHMFGNLISVSLITIHFSRQLSRSLQAPVDLGTGLMLYFTVFLLVLTGILLRFGFIRNKRAWWRYIHTGVTTAFYIIIIFHTLHGLGII